MCVKVCVIFQRGDSRKVQMLYNEWIKHFSCFCNEQGFPVVFHGVMGKDEREANSPSFFNVTEIEVIVSYLNKLIQTQGKKGLPKLSTNDIGIITPYRKQARLRMDLLLWVVKLAYNK